MANHLPLLSLIGNHFGGIRSRVRSKCCAQELNLVSVPLPVEEESTSGRFDDYFHVQADVYTDPTTHDNEHEREQIFSFLQNQEVSHVGADSAKALGDTTTDTHIKEFFARPVRAVTFQWNESDIVGAKTNYAIWSDWANNAAVKNKLNNYSFFRGDLKVKVQISASPFYYGLLQMAYQPLPSFKADTIVVDAGNRWLIPMSQRPRVLINPQVGDTYTMTLPFIYPYNLVNLQSSTDVSSLGNLRFDIYSTLKSANGVSSEGITVTVYCWVENIELSGASTGYAMQSDEYLEGPVSKPASWIANIAGKLESIPIIGKFATATRIGAGAVSTIASMFGWTNVPVIKHTDPVRTEAFPKLASSEISYPIEKLTLDPKNELSVDPRIVGLPNGVDELSIRYLTTRESFLCSSTWSTADNVDVIKFASPVTPSLLAINSTTANNVLYMIPMAWVATMFRYWRGDIIFTFRVVSSKYHKGKIRISYDPTGLATSTYNILGNANTTNVVQTTVLDIGESNEVEMVIPYQQRSQFLQLPSFLQEYWDTGPAPVFNNMRNPNFDNGLICLRVQNKLTAPVASSNVDILVYVRGGDNIEFASPEDIDNDQRLSYFAPQSDEYVETIITDKVEAGETASTTDKQYLVHFGENILSMRQVLRRISKLSTDYWPTTGTTGSYRFGYKRVLRMPPGPGFQPNAYTTANKLVGVGTYGYSFVHMTPIAWLANGFLATRGSTNYVFNVGANIPIKHARVMRLTSETAAYRFGAVETSVTTNSQMARASLTYGGQCGTAMTNQLTNAGLSVQCPMYSKLKFQSTDPNYAILGVGTDESNIDSFQLMCDYPFPAAAVTDGYIVNTYVGAGTDFGLHFFLNVPTAYRYSALPSAV